MALLNVTNIEIGNNPCNFQDNFNFQITFESTKQIVEEDCIDWTLTYVGSAKDEKQDIILDQFSMGPIDEGVMQFQIESEAPDYKKIQQQEDLLGITALILSVSYKQQEFFRVGYYVYNQYTDPDLIENEPSEVIIDKVQRSILSDKPRITRFGIDWGDGKKQEEEANYQKQAEIQEQNQNSQGLQFYENSNNFNQFQQPQVVQQQTEQQKNSISFGMFDNNNLQEINSHLLQQQQVNSNTFQNNPLQQQQQGQIQQDQQQQQQNNTQVNNPFNQNSIF